MSILAKRLLLAGLGAVALFGANPGTAVAADQPVSERPIPPRHHHHHAGPWVPQTYPPAVTYLYPPTYYYEFTPPPLFGPAPTYYGGFPNYGYSAQVVGGYGPWW
jgi:hypothetical protein